MNRSDIYKLSQVFMTRFPVFQHMQEYRFKDELLFSFLSQTSLDAQRDRLGGA
jgi:hypothetical protein